MANPDTPLMRQYNEVKTRFQDSLLFFRMGDFYELFFQDALVASKALEIALTSRNKNDPDPVPMCGVPHHAATNYINRLVSSGHKVAICEQLEDPAVAKGIVKRDVVRVVSPGTRLDPEALEAKAPNYTHAAVPRPAGQGISWATCDFTTGRFWFGASPTVEEWLSYAGSQGLVEVLLPETQAGQELFLRWREEFAGVFAQTTPAFYFEADYASERIREQFGVSSLTAVHPSLAEHSAPVGALIKYFQETQKAPRIPSAVKIDLWGQEGSMELDPSTVRALELMPTRSKRDVSLLSWMDRTKTAMGGRLMRDWVLHPLTRIEEINARLDQVEALAQSFAELHPVLNEIYDLERLLSRVSLNSGSSAGPRDLFALAQSMIKARELAAVVTRVEQLRFVMQSAVDAELLALADAILGSLSREALPATAREGRVFRKGTHPGLDELIELSENGEQWLAQFEASERQKTGIGSLKVRYNRVFGYYIEVTKANLSAVPAHYIRKQTMVGGERFITEELKSFEEKILTAEKKRCDLEYALFRDYCGRLAGFSEQVIRLARAVAHVDAIASLAALASEDGYVRPALDTTTALEIVDGRHPTVSVAMREFVPNSVRLDGATPFLIITGPNMGGKSTVMRQTALIVLMAQMGSFVPARSARVGVADRVFTRIGASDNIAEGASTFMVEMSEMSFILRHATSRSLILIDEIGRGTSTYDGMSLAWALAHDIASRVGARTLFATHYHELTQLAEYCDGVANARVAVALTDHASHGTAHGIRFLYRLEHGVAERSYGILVARLAGLPEQVLAGAETMLAELESQARHPSAQTRDSGQLMLRLGGGTSGDTSRDTGPAQRSRPRQPAAPAVSETARPEPSKAAPNPADKLADRLAKLDLNNVSPMQALNLLWELKQELKR